LFQILRIANSKKNLKVVGWYKVCYYLMCNKLLFFFFYLQLVDSYNVGEFHECPQWHMCIYKRVKPPSDLYYDWDTDVVDNSFLTSVIPIQVAWQTASLDDILRGSPSGQLAKIDIDVIKKMRAIPQCINKVIKNHEKLAYDKPIIFKYDPNEVLWLGLESMIYKTLGENIRSNNLDDCVQITGVFNLY